MIQAIAVDDELPALDVIDAFCSKSGIVQLQKTFNKPTDALRYIYSHPVDLLFLDINMPSLSGIDFYKQAPKNIPAVFTTAYSEYAVEGFNINALDYLLKPFTYERFMQAVQKAQQLLAYQQQSETNSPQYISVKANYSLVKINTDDILYVEGLDDYLKIHLHNQRALVTRMTMKIMADKLPAHKFIRVHRSFIVALLRISSVRNKNIYISNTKIPLGSSYEEAFFKVFKAH